MAANDFSSGYKQVQYWLNYIEQAMKKPPKKPAPKQTDYSALVEQVSQLREEVSHLRDEVRAGRDPHRLNRADFDEVGHSFETTDGNTYTVGHYPTGRTIGEIRKTEEGWQARHRVDAEWEDVPLPEGQEEVTREHAGQYLEELYAGDLEAALEREGLPVDGNTHHRLDQLHNAENALHRGVEKQRVLQYLDDHRDPTFTGNENSVHVDVVPGSTVWNVSDSEQRELIESDSPYAQRTAERTERDLHQRLATEQVAEQATPAGQTATEGPQR